MCLSFFLARVIAYSFITSLRERAREKERARARAASRTISQRRVLGTANDEASHSYFFDNLVKASNSYFFHNLVIRLPKLLSDLLVCHVIAALQLLFRACRIRGHLLRIALGELSPVRSLVILRHPFAPFQLLLLLFRELFLLFFDVLLQVDDLHLDCLPCFGRLESSLIFERLLLLSEVGELRVLEVFQFLGVLGNTARRTRVNTKLDAVPKEA